MLKGKFKKYLKLLTQSQLLREFFYFLNLLLVSLISLEIISPNIVLAYFNLNYLFILYLIIALILLIFPDYQNKSTK